MKAWENFLGLQEAELGVETVDKWLRPLKLLHFDAGNLYLEAKDSFHALWFEEHIRHKLQTKLLNNNNRRIRLHLSVANQKKAARTTTTRRRSREAKPTPKPVSTFSLSFDELDPHCTFANLVVNESNQLAYKLLCEITKYDPNTGQVNANAEPSVPAFNPIYLYGGSGTGKTHLLMATAHCLRSQGIRAIYSRTESFTEHVVSAIRAGEMQAFRQAYRNIDVLLIEDVHIFSRKGATQEELFHTFNTLHVAGKQIILSAYCPPQELQLIEPRLVSRFEWGVVLPLAASDPDSVKTIVEKKSGGAQFSPDR